MKRIPWKDLAVVSLTMALAWGLRGQHGHERGGALAGAMVGLSLAAVTGGARWIGAAVIGSLGFAIGGALSYGRFVHLAYQGSLEAIGTLALIGFVWGGFGCLGLGLGLALPKYRGGERAVIAGGLFLVWFVVDQLLWGQMTGPSDLAAREWMVLFLLVSFGLLSAYVGVWKKDRTSLQIAISGGIGFSVGFLLAAWVQETGPLTGIRVDWWRTAEHVIGLCGGIGLSWAALGLESSWRLPVAVRPWERWLALVWLLWLLPTWQMSNNLSYWISERVLLPVWVDSVIWGALLFILALFFIWGWLEIRRGRVFATSWMPRYLHRIFFIFLWLTTLSACSKSLLAGDPLPTPIGFLLLAFLISCLLPACISMPK